MSRTPNSTCSKCNKSLYRRPNQIKKYSHISYVCKDCRKIKLKNCKYCSEEFIPEKKTSLYCSRSCGNTSRRGINYLIKSQNKTQFRLNILKKTFDVNECMIIGCNYNTCFDIHRFIPGKLGGKYEIGNMFMICPNHHAEVTRKIIKLYKVNNYSLFVLN